MTPLWFGPEERPLFGCWHAPEGPVREAAVVLCPPFGYDYASAFRTYRQLAIDLAKAGFPVLRFDYDGTGDSAGDDRDPGRVEAWLESVRRAADEARARGGVEKVALFGLRFGGLMAAAAAERVGAASLVVWAAPSSGRAYGRELKMLSEAADPELARATPLVPSPLGEKDIDAGGFLLAAETVEALGKLNLVKLARPPAPRALVIVRDDLGEDRALSDAWTSLGVDVTHVVQSGYATLMQNAQNAVIPQSVLARTCEWLSSHHGPAPTPAAAAGRGRDAAVLEGGAVRERPISFAGQWGELHGVLTEKAQAGERRRALILLNNGAIRRIGPSRMHVRIARACASRLALTTLRLDMGGLGDSDGSGSIESHIYDTRVVADVRAAIAHLREHHGVERVVLAGLCSGAYASFHSARVDPAIESVILINPQTFFFKPGSSLDIARRASFQEAHYYGMALLRWDRWRNLIAGRSDLRGIARFAISRVRARTAEWLAGLRGRLLGFPPNEVSSAFREVVARRVRVYLLYSSGDDGHRYIEEHLGRGLSHLPRRAPVEMEVVPGPDHSFTPIWSQIWLQERLTRLLAGWCA